MKKLSLSFRVLRRLRIIHSEEKYGNKSFPAIAWLMFKTAIGLFKMTLKRLAYGYCYFGLLFNDANKFWLRAWLWRKMGAHVGKDVEIYHRVAFDYFDAKRIFIDDDVAIANGCTLLCHMKKFEDYRYVGDSTRDIPYIYGEIHLKKGCRLGMNAMIMPGVTVGEGSIVGACSFVVKDVPPWTVVAGNPAREIKRLQPRPQAEKPSTPESQ